MGNALPSPAAGTAAYVRASTVRVDVFPDREGWTYRVGEKVRTYAAVTADGHPLKGAAIQYRVGPEMMPAEDRTEALPADRH